MTNSDYNQTKQLLSLIFVTIVLTGILGLGLMEPSFSTELCKFEEATSPGSLIGTPGNDVIIGTTGNDVIDGLGGDDIICGGDGDDIIFGGDGKDYIYGGNGDDNLFGGNEKDWIFGQNNNDYLHGGAGPDILKGNSHDDVIYGGDDNDLDTIHGGFGTNVCINENDDFSNCTSPYREIKTCGGLPETNPGSLIGTVNNDVIVGTSGDDDIDGLDGNDTICGLDGNDTIYGGSGDDIIFGDEGIDIILGNEDDDFIDGGSGDDVLKGNGQHDNIIGGTGNDSIIGGFGTNTCIIDSVDGDVSECTERTIDVFLPNIVQIDETLMFAIFDKQSGSGGSPAVEISAVPGTSTTPTIPATFVCDGDGTTTAIDDVTIDVEIKINDGSPTEDEKTIQLIEQPESNSNSEMICDGQFLGQSVIQITPSQNTDDNLQSENDGDVVTVDYFVNSLHLTDTVIVSHVDTAPNITGLRHDYDLFFDKLTCATTDIDEDGICPEWESNGNELQIFDPAAPTVKYIFDCDQRSKYGPLHPDKCDDTTKDIFLEIDYMEGHRPSQLAVDLVVEAFGKNGYNLHIQIDDEPAIDHYDTFAFPGSDGGTKGFSQLKSTEFGTVLEKQNYMNWNDVERRLKHQAFHYALFVHQQDGDLNINSSGIAEVYGNDILVSLGSFYGGVGSIDQQAGTLMHELGHNVRLHHGGGNTDEYPQCKPNHFSVMNYARQFSNYDPGRILDFSHEALGNTDSNDDMLLESSLQQNPGMEPSTGPNTERILYTCSGILSSNVFFPDGTAVDWDCDENTTSSISVNINDFSECRINPATPDNSISPLEGHADWDEVSLTFKDNSNFADGIHHVAGGVSFPINDTNVIAISNSDEMSLYHVTLQRINALASLYRDLYSLPDAKFNQGLMSHKLIDVLPTDTISFSSSDAPPILTSENFLSDNEFNAAFASEHISLTKNDSLQSQSKIPSLLYGYTDSSKYEYRDKVTIIGNIENYDSSYSEHGLTYKVKSADNKIVTIGQLTPNADGTFHDNFVAGGIYWNLNGKYVIELYFGDLKEEIIISYVDVRNSTEPIPVPIMILTTEHTTIKQAFLSSVESLIDSVNHHDLEQAREDIKWVNYHAWLTLPDDYGRVARTLNDIGKSYDIAMDFEPTSIHKEHIALTSTIVHPLTVSDMIAKAEAFVDSTPSYIPEDHPYSPPPFPIPTFIPWWIFVLVALYIVAVAIIIWRIDKKESN